jgi:hypothetical protein
MYMCDEVPHVNRWWDLSVRSRDTYDVCVAYLFAVKRKEGARYIIVSVLPDVRSYALSAMHA